MEFLSRFSDLHKRQLLTSVLIAFIATFALFATLGPSPSGVGAAPAAGAWSLDHSVVNWNSLVAEPNASPMSVAAYES